jgi:NitT/TauT family transport system ATP-binding protein
MFQAEALMPWRSALQNVIAGLQYRETDEAKARQLGEEWLARVGLQGFGDRYPHQLSGGMRQRVALARTLAVDPSVLLLDEPFSAVDAQTRMVLQRDLAQTLKVARKTALLITHDLAEAVTLSDRVLVMSRRPGTIIDEITIDMAGRDNPIARRHDPKLGDYVARLMDRLDIDHAALEQPAAGDAA